MSTSVELGYCLLSASPNFHLVDAYLGDCYDTLQMACGIMQDLISNRTSSPMQFKASYGVLVQGGGDPPKPCPLSHSPSVYNHSPVLKAAIATREVWSFGDLQLENVWLGNGSTQQILTPSQVADESKRSTRSH